ncbi:hypothetical protein [Lysinibacillus xylanilyticus]|uniref:hypothetical protein n=1 Tax=Lysinibacillus xylanilyticus TaxID=582475 RepID=UPI00083C97AD|nr:hypothetical protein [Lysinibacillus xylanilyticus]
MKLTKGFLVLFLSVSVLSACNQGDKTNHDSEIKSSVEKAVKKHEAVDLPVDVFRDSNYGFSSHIFTRSITHVEFKDFDESSELEFLDRYDKTVRGQNYDYQKDFKLLVITMKHEEQGGSPYQSFVFNDGTGLVIGDDNLANKSKFLRYQQEYVTNRVGPTTDETGTILLAVPNEFANDKNLQLKIVQKLDKESDYIYIDLKQ